MAAAQYVDDASAITDFPIPSPWWCRWQALKGTNFTHLTVPSVDLSNRLVVITGANSGIGREAALQFSQWGANVILGCREPPPHEMHPSLVVDECKSAARAAGYDKSSIEWWQVDMGSLKTVEEFGKRLLQSGKPIDILANNAGMPGTMGKVTISGDGFEILHQVNFLSHVLLTMTVLPLLSKAEAPRIICTTSCMQYFGVFDLKNANSGRNDYPNNKLYFQTWLTELQHRMSAHKDYAHVTIHGVHPGYVKTNIWRARDPDALKKLSLAGKALGFFLHYVGIDAQQGSLCITNAATGPAFSVKTQKSGTASSENLLGGARYFNRVWDETPMPQTKDVTCRRLVWEYVNNALKLEEKSLLTELGA